MEKEKHPEAKQRILAHTRCKRGKTIRDAAELEPAARDGSELAGQNKRTECETGMTENAREPNASLTKNSSGSSRETSKEI